MSTTVSYKGSTIATVTNETKTLNTAGTWVEGDIQIVDATTGKYTATVTSNGTATNTYIEHNSKRYKNYSGMFTFSAGDTLLISASSTPGGNGEISIDGTQVASSAYTATYTYTLPAHNINIAMNASQIFVTSTLQSKTVSYTPSETAQTATVTADSGYDGLGSVDISVGAISGTYVGSQVPTQAAQTIHPSTSAQTIASGRYLTGAQTIEAVTTNLTADKIASGFTAKIGSVTDDDCVVSIVGTASGGGTYRRTQILPLQTITPGSGRTAVLSNMSMLEDGEYYIVTFDGVEWAWTCETLWGSAYTLGDVNLYFGNSGDFIAPFGLGMDFQGNADIAVKDTNQHTVKIEKLEFVDDGEVLTTKTITSNGTYNASSDNADGYSSVVVNIPSGAPTLQAKTNISPTISSQIITADSGYDGLSSVQINAMPTGTAGTPTATKGTVSNHSVSITPSVTNTTGYITGGTKTGTAVTVSASELVSGSETKTANGTYDVTNLASIVVNVPSSGGSTLGTKTIIENGTFSASADGYDGYSSVTVNVPTGGSSGIKIGIETTSIPNILNMFYALENGTAKTGEFTLAQSIPNTSTLIFDTGLSTVNGLFIADESQATRNTGNTPENTLWAIVFNPGSSTGSYAMTRLNIQMGYGTNQSGVNRGFLNRVYAWEVTDGKLYATAQYNRNNNYTPFYPGHTYRWVAW